MDRKTVLITGCSSGIGHHAAHALAGRGWRVLATCRKMEDCQRLETEGLESFPIDYADDASIEAGFETAMERTGGRLDALFNNGAYAIPGALEDIPVDALRAIFQTNFFGWHCLTQKALSVMRHQGHGRILQNSSVLGFSALRFRGAYIATKFAIEGYTDTLRLELGKTGIRVILLEPGPVRTRIRENARQHYEKWTRKHDTPWADLYRRKLEPRLYAENPPRDWGERLCDATTRQIVRALEHPRPGPRYFVTPPTYIMGGLRRILPSRMLDSILIRG